MSRIHQYSQLYGTLINSLEQYRYGILLTEKYEFGFHDHLAQLGISHLLQCHLGTSAYCYIPIIRHKPRFRFMSKESTLVRRYPLQSPQERRARDDHP